MHSTCLQLDIKTIDFTGCVHGFEWRSIGVRVMSPLCVEHLTNLPLRKKKQQCLAIFCLRNGIFGDMAVDMAVDPGPRPASRRLQYCKRREAGRRPGDLRYLVVRNQCIEILFDCRWIDHK